MTRITAFIAAGLLAVPAAAFAQARNGNVYDGTAHEPVPGTVRQDERAAGIAPSQQTLQSWDQTLGAIDRQLTQQTQQDTAPAPSAGKNVYGVGPNGVVPITPDAGPAGGATGSAAGH